LVVVSFVATQAWSEETAATAAPSVPPAKAATPPQPSVGGKDIVPMQVEIEVQYVSFPKDEIARLAAQGIVDASPLRRLWQTGKAELITASKVVTRTGTEASVRSVVEYIYPTEFNPPCSPVGTNAADQAAMTGDMVTPHGFETREVGEILTVLPEVSTDGSRVNLTINPQYVFEPEWRDYGGERTDASGHKRLDKMEQPFFPNDSVTTQLTVYDGATILASGSQHPKDKGKMIYVFVTARLIGPDGVPIRKPSRAEPEKADKTPTAP
jgi:hypothetical protein